MDMSKLQDFRVNLVNLDAKARAVLVAATLSAGVAAQAAPPISGPPRASTFRYATSTLESTVCQNAACTDFASLYINTSVELDGTTTGIFYVQFNTCTTFHCTYTNISCAGPEFAAGLTIRPPQETVRATYVVDPASPSCQHFGTVPSPFIVELSGSRSGTFRETRTGVGHFQSAVDIRTVRYTFDEDSAEYLVQGQIGANTGTFPALGSSYRSRLIEQAR